MRIDIDAVICSQPWLISPEGFDLIRAVAAREGDVEALETKLGRELDNARTVTVRDGVATVPVNGPIFRYANLFTEISGATSTQVLATDIQTAMDDPKVKAILLNIDSPGGAVAGTSELADSIREWSARKPIYAYISDLGASAAYWLGASASKVFAADSALVGSIGVVSAYMDTRKRDEKQDVRRMEIVSSASPDKRIDPTTDEGRAKVQKTVDHLGNLFVAKIAAYRGVDTAKVLADFGRGGVLPASEALAAGMIDGVSSYEAVHAALVSKVRSNLFMGVSRMSTKLTVNSQGALLAAVAAVAAGTVAAADLVYESQTASADQIRDAVQAERTRIAAIQAFAEPGFEKLVADAITSGATVEATALSILKAQKDRGVSVAAMRQDGQAVQFAPPAKPLTEAEAKKAETTSAWGFALKSHGVK